MTNIFFICVVQCRDHLLPVGVKHLKQFSEQINFIHSNVNNLIYLIFVAEN